MSSVSIDKLTFDTSAMDESANVGAYLRSSDGTLITHSTDGSNERLDVSSGAEHYEDAAHVSGDKGSFALAVRQDADSSMVSADGDYAPLQVNADGKLKVIASVSLDSEYAEDSAHVSGDIGSFSLGVRSDAEAALAADGDYHPFLFNSVGRLKVDAEISLVTGFEKAEDAAHVSGDIGGYVLSVRQDTLASSTSADGDYQSFKTDSLGRIWANVDRMAPQDGHSTSTYGQNSIGITAELVVSALSNRKKILVQNVSGNRTVYLGNDNAVTTANGIRLSANSSVELELGAGIDLYAISNTASADLRYFELA